MKKDKVYELRIEEDDDISGIDSISLVSEPAIEVNWVAFKKEKQEEFHIPDGEDDLYTEKLMALAQDENELFADGWEISSIHILNDKDSFYSTSPNSSSTEDEKEYNVRYKYMLNPRISQSPVIKTTRKFCKDLLAKNYVWRVEDMEATMNDFGQSAMVWRGGYNCRHVWARIEYKKDVEIINKASVNKGKIDPMAPPDVRVLGYDEPSTVTTKTLNNPSPITIKNLGLSKELDLGYDNTLPAYVDPDIKKKKVIPKGLVTGGTISTFDDHFKYYSSSKEKLNFVTDEDKHIVVGPAMIPDQKIFRKDALGNPYYVFFSSDTIKMIAEKYMKNKYIDNNDTEHNGKAASDVYVIESWIKEDENDKSTKYGFNDLPVGTWFVSMRVKNPEVWKAIKSKELNGFSVSGFFEEVAAFCKEEMFLKEVAKIISKIN